MQRTLIFRLLPALTVFTMAASHLQGQITLIEENFDEANPGAHLTANQGGDGYAAIRPTYGRYQAFMNDKAEIVPGLSGEGQALQFQDQMEDAAMRLVFGATDVDPVTTGKIEVSLDFRIESEAPIERGIPLVIKLSAPTNSNFLTVLISGEGGHILHTNRSTNPAYEGMVLGAPVQPGVTYTLKITADLETSTYRISVRDKKEGEQAVLWDASDQEFIPIPDLETNGVGVDLLEIQAGAPDFSQGAAAVTTTVDHILVRHLE